LEFPCISRALPNQNVSDFLFKPQINQPAGQAGSQNPYMYIYTLRKTPGGPACLSFPLNSWLFLQLAGNKLDSLFSHASAIIYHCPLPSAGNDQPLNR